MLVRVKAASLNYRDLLVSQGKYPGLIKPSVIPLSDGAGEVADIGPGVKKVGIGARVMGTFYPDWMSGPISEEVTTFALGGSLDGVLAEYIVLPEHAVVAVPPGLPGNEPGNHSLWLAPGDRPYLSAERDNTGVPASGQRHAIRKDRHRALNPSRRTGWRKRRLRRPSRRG